MNTKQIIEELGLTGGHYKLTTNRMKTPIVKDTNTGEIVAKKCSKCSVIKLYKDMKKDSRPKDGMASQCLNCQTAYNDIPENKDRQAELRNIPEVKERLAEYDAEWSRNNPDKKAKSIAKRRARKRNLPNETIEKYSFDTCILTGATDNVHIEHMIPLNWGHGGTTFANVYAMEGSANKSKNDSNPFEWYESNGTRYGITSEAWSDLIKELSSRNGMNPDEYIRFVNWCYDNPRTLEEIIADNERYGFIVDSATLWRDSTAKQSETRLEASTLDVVPV